MLQHCVVSWVNLSQFVFDEIENETARSYVVSAGTTANNVVDQWSALHDRRLRVIGVEQSLADTNFVRTTRTGLNI